MSNNQQKLSKSQNKIGTDNIPNNGRGRPKGAINKTTGEVREAIAAFASANVDNMTEWLNLIDSPEKKLDLFLRAIEYHIPKLARTEHAGDKENPVIVNTYSWLE
jgi:hypothetical protein